LGGQLDLAEPRQTSTCLTEIVGSPALRLTNSLPSCVQKLVESETLMETKIGASIKMFDISYHRTTASVLAVGLGVLFLGLVQPARALPIDSTLFTTYESNGNTNITWVTCGSTTNTSGCYGAGTLGPFNRVCAIMEGEPVTVGNTVTRSIYVLDGGSNTISVSLNVFKKTDIITSNGDTVSITPSKKLTLPLIGGSHASCAVAANNGFIFVGTNASPNAVRVNKLTYSLTKVGAFSLPVTAITANDYGYVTVTQEAATQGSGFSVYGPNGMPQEDGGGASFIPNTTNAYLPP
jgi:hypothetical protein